MKREKDKVKKAKKPSKLRGRLRNVFRSKHTVIATFLIALFGAVIIVIGSTNIAALVYMSEKVTVGDGAPMVLMYDKPASRIALKQPLINRIYSGTSENNRYQQTVLPLGNGDMGASVYGEIATEKIVFNEKTLWTGGPKPQDTAYNGGNITGADPSGKSMSDYYYEVIDLLKSGKDKEAEKVFENIRGDRGVYGSYQRFGDIALEFGHKRASDYKRQLDIDNSVATVQYKTLGVSYTREYFVSNPDNVFAAKIEAAGGSLNFKVKFSSSQGAESAIRGNSIVLSGELSDNGLKYYAALTVDVCGGKSVPEGDGIRISDTSEAVIFVSAATDYADNFPVYRTGERLSDIGRRVENTVAEAMSKGYELVKERHIADYRNLYDGFRINLGGKSTRYTTDKLVRKYATPYIWNSERRYLEQLMTCYGRYLLISSSRGNSKLPANLQGVWNNLNDPAWGSDYHININLQMNYWPAYVTGLAECSEPLVNFVEAIKEPGRITAKTYTGTAEEALSGLADEEYGFIAHTECTPFGYTAPGEGKYIKANWAPPAVAWLIQNLYERYEYDLDTGYLARIYPTMKEAVRYFDRTLIDDGSGKLVAAPSYSPEHGGIELGTTYEQSLIWQLYNDTIEAAETLGCDGEQVEVWKSTKDRLRTVEIGKSGQVKEWYDETILGAESFFHRHTSQLLGLYPGDLISDEASPEWLNAAIVSLKRKSDITTGWASAQRISLWARTGNGNKAYDTLAGLINNSVYPNLWDAHPPFQIDGNLGLTAGVAEMLIQSNAGTVSLLPALPNCWENGEARGLRIRGNAEISLFWNDCVLSRAELTAISNGTMTLKAKGLEGKGIYTASGSPVDAERDGNRIIFNAVAGEMYVIK